MPVTLTRARRRNGARGQSLVEFTLTLPILLILTMVAIDFGRVYLGWINLQNMARVAANYAADNPRANWGNPADPVVVKYQNQVRGDAKASNCDLPKVAGTPTAASPVFSGTNLGDTVTVNLRCNFGVITPVISSVIGSQISVGATSTFPVKSGIGAAGGGVGSAPTASFTASPTSGGAGMTVTFTDTSTGSPTSWTWDFGDGATATGQGPKTHQYNIQGTWNVTLTVSNSNGSNTTNPPTVITVGPAQAVDFSGVPTSGNVPLTVAFSDLSTGGPTSWAWTFGDSQTSNLQNPTHVYSAAGQYTVTLTVTYAIGGPLTATKTNYIVTTTPVCVVPNFANTSSSTAQSTWTAAGFTTTVQFKQGGLPWTIKSQDLTGNSSKPCDSVITVSKN
jgi:PKD repeat protein